MLKGLALRSLQQSVHPAARSQAVPFSTPLILLG